jgi:hypothetical protein
VRCSRPNDHRPSRKADRYREEHGGPDALKLVSYRADKAVLAICETWAGDYDSSEFQRMGFEVDDKETGYAQAVLDFKEELAAREGVAPSV